MTSFNDWLQWHVTLITEIYYINRSYWQVRVIYRSEISLWKPMLLFKVIDNSEQSVVTSDISQWQFKVTFDSNMFYDRYYYKANWQIYILHAENSMYCNFEVFKVTCMVIKNSHLAFSNYYNSADTFGQHWV